MLACYSSQSLEQAVTMFVAPIMAGAASAICGGAAAGFTNRQYRRSAADSLNAPSMPDSILVVALAAGSLTWLIAQVGCRYIFAHYRHGSYC